MLIIMSISLIFRSLLLSMYNIISNTSFPTAIILVCSCINWNKIIEEWIARD